MHKYSGSGRNPEEGQRTFVERAPAQLGGEARTAQRIGRARERDQVRRAYKFILDAARCAEHLIPYLNAALLKDVWPDLGMPYRKRAAWEALNPELRTQPAVTAA